MVLSPFAESIFRQKYSMDGRETWPDCATRVATYVMAALGYSRNAPETRRIEQYITDRKFIPGGRYLYASGRDLHQVQNCLLLRAEDSREGWGHLWQRAGTALMTGAGIGVDYSDIREQGALVSRTGGEASGPLSLMYSINEIGRQVMQGGSRRSAIWAGLRWDHPDIFKFISYKDWSPALRQVKEIDFNFPAPMELTNISVILDDAFFAAISEGDTWAEDVYRRTIRRMCKTGEPGFSIDVGENAGETLRNACTEVTSADDSDVCNLGSVNLGAIDTIEEFRDVLDAATLFLLAGTVYSDVPYSKVAKVRSKNRRLGLGLMGVHEWLLKRDHAYDFNHELDEWLGAYALTTDVAADWADTHSLSRPVKTRSIAPTGTIAIIGETTTGIEPIYCVAYLRRYMSGSAWSAQYVVDPTAQRLIQSGVDPHFIEDAFALASDAHRRITVQEWIQRYVDHGISSTVNLPAPLDVDEAIDFGDMLLPHLPNLRGMTVYPNGARGGQPITPASYEEAMRHVGVVFEESPERCVAGACGI